MRARAEGGDGDAMLDLGKWYFFGRMGLARDRKQAAGWYQRGHDVGHASCTVRLGLRYALGEGVELDKAYALCLYGIAARGDSELGCYMLAVNLANGWAGLRENAREATRWYRAMESATVRDASDNARNRAAKWLREHAVDS